MDKQSLIGFTLIFAIFIIWYSLISNYYGNTPSESSPEKKSTPHVVDVEKDNIQEIPQEQTSSQASNIEKRASYLRGNEKIYTIETPLYTAKISSKGASLVSFIQKKHVAHGGIPFNMISNKEGATSLLLSTKDGKVISTPTIFFESNFSQQKVTLKKEDTLNITFNVLLDSLSRASLKIQYTFISEDYAVGYKVNLDSNTPFLSGQSYQVIWTGGIPQSEKDKKDEADHSYANALMGDELLKLDADDADEVYKLEPDGNTKWVATQNKYFVASIIAKKPSGGAYLSGTYSEVENPIENYTIALKEFFRPNTRSISSNFLLYIGPLDYYEIKSLNVGLERTIDFGLEWLTRPFSEYLIIPLFTIMEQHISNYGIILILFAVLIKIVTYPLSISQTRSMKKMSSVQPKLQKLQSKYKNEPMKLQKEMSKLYRESGINPLGGCLPLLLQLPILLALFNVFGASIQLRQKPFLWIDDLSLPDAIIEFPFSIPLYGDHFALLPVLMAISMYLQMKLTPSASIQTGPAAMQAKIFKYIFPAMMLLIFNNTPSGLSLYYFTFNVVSILQQLLINKTLQIPKVALPVDKKK